MWMIDWAGGRGACERSSRIGRLSGLQAEELVQRQSEAADDADVQERSAVGPEAEAMGQHGAVSPFSHPLGRVCSGGRRTGYQ